MEKRLDVFLVDAYGIKSRSKAQALIRNGCVTCNGKVITKTGFLVSETNTIKIIDETVLRYVSRGGLKLEKAIDVFQLDFNEKTILDIGSSTGGFTDCSIQHGAKKVIAVDVGTNIMDYKLSMDERVELHEETGGVRGRRNPYEHVLEHWRVPRRGLIQDKHFLRRKHDWFP